MFDLSVALCILTSGFLQRIVPGPGYFKFRKSVYTFISIYLCSVDKLLFNLQCQNKILTSLIRQRKAYMKLSPESRMKYRKTLEQINAELEECSKKLKKMHEELVLCLIKT